MVKVLGLGVCRVFVMRVLWLGMYGETPRVCHCGEGPRFRRVW